GVSAVVFGRTVSSSRGAARHNGVGPGERPQRDRLGPEAGLRCLVRGAPFDLAGPENPVDERVEGVAGRGHFPGGPCDGGKVPRQFGMKLLIVGGGGQGCVVADAAQASSAGWSEIAFLDDRYPELRQAGSWNVVGRFADLEGMKGRFDACFAAVGDA